jgi:hypothetical protein
VLSWGGKEITSGSPLEFRQDGKGVSITAK